EGIEFEVPSDKNIELDADKHINLGDKFILLPEEAIANNGYKINSSSTYTIDVSGGYIILDATSGVAASNKQTPSLDTEYTQKHYVDSSISNALQSIASGGSLTSESYSSFHGILGLMGEFHTNTWEVVESSSGVFHARSIVRGIFRNI